MSIPYDDTILDRDRLERGFGIELDESAARAAA